MSTIPEEHKSDVFMKTPKKAHESEVFLELLTQHNMPTKFYDSVLQLMSNRDGHVMCIYKMIERQESDKFNNISDEKKKLYIDDFIINLLKSSQSKGLKKIYQICCFTDNDIQQLNINNYSVYDSFLVFGCPLSTDIDIVVFVDKFSCHMGNTKALSNNSIREIKDALNSLGYETINKELDITCVYVDPNTKNITASSKGGSETQNIINATWIYHKQVMNSTNTLPLGLHNHPIIDCKMTDEDVYNKLRALSKYIIDYLEDICNNTQYKEIRMKKKEAYTQGNDQIITFMKEHINYIIYSPEEANNNNLNLVKFHDRYKSIIIKLLQILLLYRCDKMIYTKTILAHHVHEIFELELNNNILLCEDINAFEQGALWYLFRGRIGTYCSKLFPILIKIYFEITTLFLARTQIDPIVFNKELILNVNININSELLSLFIESPINPTSNFEDMFVDIYGSREICINKIFIIKSSSETHFYDTYSTLDNDIINVFKKCFIFVDQRTPEWIDMLSNKFACGSNTGSINDSSFQGRYNLIRGAIIELIAIQLFDPLTHANLINFKKWNLGFIIESNIQGSKGFSPDLVLMSEDSGHHIPEFILVEIKGLKTSRKNADYYRGLHLAKKQVESGKNILSKYINNEKLIINRGIILLCYIEEQQFKMEVHHISF